MNHRVHALALLSAGLAACGPSPAAETDPARPAAAPAAPTPAVVAKAPPDPMTDVGAWKALPAEDRARRAAEVVAKADASSVADVDRTRRFLDERAETAAVTSLAACVLGKGSSASWAHEAVGDVDLRKEVDACLAHCPECEEAEDARWLDLKSQRAKKGESWWANPEEAKRVRALVAEVSGAEKELATPYGKAIAHWTRWQRAIDVMKDSPAIHGARGPYLVFVSLRTKKVDPKAEPSRAQLKGDLKEVPPEEIARGKAILGKTQDLLEHFYDGWMTNLGPIFGFTRYTPENTDDSVLLKMNVFHNEEEYRLYNAKTGTNASGFARAYYMPEEPRFITTYDGEDEDPALTAHVQCHEATHQLVHLYTWDLSRKALKRDVTWLDCEVTPLWSGEGFAEFYSSFVVKDGKYLWMQPFDYRMMQLRVFGDVARERKWAPFDLKEILTFRHGGQLQEAGARRGGHLAKPRAEAMGIMGSLYYAKAWSLVYFLWYAEEGGKPKYRDRLVEYLKREFHVEFKMDPVKKHEIPTFVGMKDFRQIMGLTADDKFAAFEKEWQAYEAKLLDAHQRPEWTEYRTQVRKGLGLDK